MGGELGHMWPPARRGTQGADKAQILKIRAGGRARIRVPLPRPRLHGCAKQSDLQSVLHRRPVSPTTSPAPGRPGRFGPGLAVDRGRRSVVRCGTNVLCGRHPDAEASVSEETANPCTHRIGNPLGRSGAAALVRGLLPTSRSCGPATPSTAPPGSRGPRVEPGISSSSPAASHGRGGTASTTVSISTGSTRRTGSCRCPTTMAGPLHTGTTERLPERLPAAAASCRNRSVNPVWALRVAQPDAPPPSGLGLRDQCVFGARRASWLRPLQLVHALLRCAGSASDRPVVGPLYRDDRTLTSCLDADAGSAPPDIVGYIVGFGF